jgi:hypothetical protein
VDPNLLEIGSRMMLPTKWSSMLIGGINPAESRPVKWPQFNHQQELVVLACEHSCVPPHGTARTICRVNGFDDGGFLHKTLAKHWQLPKQSQVGKSQSNKPAFQLFQHFSHALMTTIVSTIQFYKTRKAAHHIRS